MLNGKVSERERQILVLASQGLTDKEISGRLGISIRTVGTYWERLKEKTQARSRSHVIMQTLGRELETLAEKARQARRELEILLEQAEHYAVFGIGLDGTLLDWNIGVLKVLGYAKEEFVGEPFSLIFTDDDVRRAVPQMEIEEALKHGRFPERRYHCRKDGTHIWIDGMLVAIYNSEGEVFRFSKIMRDDSQRKSMEDEIQRLQAVMRDGQQESTEPSHYKIRTSIHEH